MLTIKVEKEMIRRLGLNPSIVYGELKNQLAESIYTRGLKLNDFFPCTVEKLREETTLSAEQQRNALKILEDEGIIEQALIGLPRVRHFKIVYLGVSSEEEI